MKRNQDPEERSKKLMKEMNDALRDAENAVRNMDSLYERAGINREDVKRFLSSDRAPAEVRREMEQEISRFQDEMDHPSPERPRPRAKKVGMRRGIVKI